jgi:uncharacterized membrane protein YhfC
VIPLNWGAAAGLALAAFLCGVGPVLLAWWWRRRTGPSFRIFGIGALVFFVSQVVLRLPWQIPLARSFRDRPGLVLPFLLFSAFTAAVFEETGRWAGYRYLVRERSRRTGVMLGLGHGGFEAMLLVALPLASLLIAWWLASRGSISPGPTLESVRHQTASLDFWNIQLATLERASGLATHVGLSLIVLQVWLRRSLAWLLLAMALHFAINAIGASLVHSLRVYPLLAELVVAALAAGILLLGWKLTAGSAAAEPVTSGSSGAAGSP